MPQDIRSSPDGSVFFVADMKADGLRLIDPASFTQIGFIHTGKGTHGIYPSRDGRLLVRDESRMEHAPGAPARRRLGQRGRPGRAKSCWRRGRFPAEAVPTWATSPPTERAVGERALRRRGVRLRHGERARSRIASRSGRSRTACASGRSRADTRWVIRETCDRPRAKRPNGETTGVRQFRCWPLASLLPLSSIPLRVLLRSRNVPPFSRPSFSPSSPSLAPRRKRSQVPRRSPSDPYLWLEDQRGARAMAWVATENAKTTGVLEKDPRFASLFRDALAVAQASDRIPNVRFIGRSALQLLAGQCARARHLALGRRWRAIAPRRRSGRQFSISTRWRAAEKANWVWEGADCALPAERRCLLSLSDGGEDAVTLREFDLATRRVPEGWIRSSARQAERRVGR